MEEEKENYHLIRRLLKKGNLSSLIPLFSSLQPSLALFQLSASPAVAFSKYTLFILLLTISNSPLIQATMIFLLDYYNS